MPKPLMENEILTIGGIVLTIFIGEVLLWQLFSKRVAPITFPHDVDTSFLRFFSPTRLRVVAFLHTIGLCALTIFVLMRLW